MSFGLKNIGATYQLKALISKPPVLASPKPSETILLYITTTTQVISAALVVEREESGMSTRWKGQSTTSTRSSPTVKLAIIRYKNYFMPS
jgi:hypothetical protein